MKETCATCKHSFVDLQGAGWCRRYPPLPFLHDAKSGASSAFPPIMPDWSCGEHAPRLVLAASIGAAR